MNAFLQAWLLATKRRHFCRLFYPWGNEGTGGKFTCPVSQGLEARQSDSRARSHKSELDAASPSTESSVSWPAVVWK